MHVNSQKMPCFEHTLKKVSFGSSQLHPTCSLEMQHCAHFGILRCNETPFMAWDFSALCECSPPQGHMTRQIQHTKPFTHASCGLAMLTLTLPATETPCIPLFLFSLLLVLLLQCFSSPVSCDPNMNSFLIHGEGKFPTFAHNQRQRKHGLLANAFPLSQHMSKKSEPQGILSLLILHTDSDSPSFAMSQQFHKK